MSWVAALFLPLFLQPSASTQAAAADLLRVEAAFLRNFARYVTWPADVFADNRSPWHICVLGNDPFGEVLENTFKGRTEQGRSFTIIRSEKPSGLRQCQIIYVAYNVSMIRRAILAELKGLPVLTVSNAPGFLQEGGIIGFEVDNYVGMSINLDRARDASLSIQTKVLEVSNDVIENGRVRKMR